MNHKKIISDFINEEIQLSIFEKDRNKLHILKNKILNDEKLSSDDKKTIIEEILSQKLVFDNNGNPTKETIIVEGLIDFFNS